MTLKNVSSESFFIAQFSLPQTILQQALQAANRVLLRKPEKVENKEVENDTETNVNNLNLSNLLANPLITPRVRRGSLVSQEIVVNTDSAVSNPIKPLNTSFDFSFEQPEYSEAADEKMLHDNSSAEVDDFEDQEYEDQDFEDQDFEDQDYEDQEEEDVSMLLLLIW